MVHSVRLFGNLIKAIKTISSTSISKVHLSTSSESMRFVQYTLKSENVRHLGVQLKENSDIIEVSKIDQNIPNNLVEFLSGTDELRNRLKSVVKEARMSVPLCDVNLLAPLTKPDKVLCVGLNYRSHCEEQNKPYPEQPFFFNKFPSTIIGPGSTVRHPPNTRALDWEVELGVVIGRQCRGVDPNDAEKYIFGYTVCQDISARDWQKSTRNAGQWLFAKSMDDSCPTGPCVVTKEAVGNPQDLTLTCTVNGVEKQRGHTDDMVHDVVHIVSFLSNIITLLPGDLILTGTPSGVGVFRNPREFLKEGDVIETTISSIGTIVNTVVKY